MRFTRFLGVILAGCLGACLFTLPASAGAAGQDNTYEFCKYQITVGHPDVLHAGTRANTEAAYGVFYTSWWTGGVQGIMRAYILPGQLAELQQVTVHQSDGEVVVNYAPGTQSAEIVLPYDWTDFTVCAGVPNPLFDPQLTSYAQTYCQELAKPSANSMALAMLEAAWTTGRNFVQYVLNLQPALPTFTEFVKPGCGPDGTFGLG